MDNGKVHVEIGMDGKKRYLRYPAARWN